MTRFASFALAAAIALALSPRAHAVASDDAMAPSDKAANALYWEAQSSLRASDWPTALQRFEQLEKQLREREPQSADAALYWRAYTLVQARRTTEARKVVERLHREFPTSRWGGDADALIAAKDAPKAGDDGELADAAIEALLSAPPERAIPLLKRVLDGTRPARTKKRALFVLSQYDEPAALEIVAATTRHADPDLRREAIRVLGIGGQPRGLDVLRDSYASSSDPADKRAIIEAWMIAGRKDLILAAGRDEKDASVRHQATQMLGTLDAEPELRQLLDTSKDPAQRDAVLQALGIAGAASTLATIAADTKQDEPTRMAAMRGLGIAGGKEYLGEIYAKANTPALRDGALQAMLIAGDGKTMLELYRKATSTEEKKALLRMLSLVDSDAALEAIEKEL